MLTTKITFALSDWIREWIKQRNEAPSIENCIKYVEWKLDKYTLTENDKIKIETILLYETLS